MDRDRGSAAVEVVLLAPVLLAMIALVIFGGRVALARQALSAAAFDAARAASLERTAAAARTAARQAADVVLDVHSLQCSGDDLRLDLTGFGRSVGEGAEVRVDLRCAVAVGDLSLPGLPGQITVAAQATSPIDRYRERAR